MIRATDTENCEGAPSYAFTPEHSLAQYVTTGCLNSTFYASDAAQLETVLGLCGAAEVDFIARAAVYAREVGFMKDAPALLCAVLAARDGEVLEKVFPRVIDSPRMLRSFVQIVRSGVTGRKSLGSRPKRLVRGWLATRSDRAIFNASVGRSPSIADVVRMVHPSPATDSREALYGYLLGREFDPARLPEVVRQFEAFKQDTTRAVPDVPFQMLTALTLDNGHWVDIATRAPWQMTRMNLNAFARHGVFEDSAMARLVADRIRDEESIASARAMPYQLMVAFTQTDSGVPRVVADALQDAMEVAIDNVPVVDGQVVVCPDVSGSMGSAITGYRHGSTSVVRCVDVAALFAAAIMRKNPTALVLPFEHRVVKLQLNARDSVMTNAERLAAVGGGGTNCSAPLALLNRTRVRADLVVFVSDNQSWVDMRGRHGTESMTQWEQFRQRNPKARLVNIDLQPYGDTQAYDREDILNVGGFSDGVFDLVARFAGANATAAGWVQLINEVEL
jgi:60 kDa SS-A/Ro ribonucleoprotein